MPCSGMMAGMLGGEGGGEGGGPSADDDGVLGEATVLCMCRADAGRAGLTVGGSVGKSACWASESEGCSLVNNSVE